MSKRELMCLNPLLVVIFTLLWVQCMPARPPLSFALYNMSRAMIGLYRAGEAGLVLGKLSGRHALQKRLEQLGYSIEGNELDVIFLRFKAIDEKKKVPCGTLDLSTASVKLIDANGVDHVACSVGTGPVDSVYKAIDMIVKTPVTLLEYSLSAVTEGMDALATTKVIIRGKDVSTSSHSLNGESVHRTFRRLGFLEQEG